MQVPFNVKAGTNTRIEITQDILFNKEIVNSLTFGANYDYEPFEIIHIVKEAQPSVAASSIADVEFEIKGFNVNRQTEINNHAGLIANLHFGEIDSDVMHLPIPPIELKQKITFGSSVILNINFNKDINRDIFNLDYHIDYGAETSFNFIPSSNTQLDFLNEGLNSTIKTITNINNICLLNLNI